MPDAAVYVVDQNGYELTRHAAASFLMSQTGFGDLYLLCHNFEPPSTDRLIAIGEAHGIRVHLQKIETDLPLGSAGQVKDRLSDTAYLKFEAVARVAPAYDRVLYADYDILFFEDLALDKTELDGFTLAAVYDIAEISGLTDPDFIENCRKNNLSPHYFNSGLMLFDSKKLDNRMMELYVETFLQHLSSCKYKKSCKTKDQCLFNMMFENNWKRLPLDYNMQVCTKFSRHWHDAAVRHFQGPDKFLPIRLWKNDSRDIRLITRLRETLGYGPAWYPTVSGMFALNTIRNAPRIKQGNAAVALAERMRAEPFFGS